MIYFDYITETSTISTDVTTFKLKDGSKKPVIVKSKRFSNPNDKISSEGIKLDFYIDGVKIGTTNISGIRTNMPFMYDFEVKKEFRNQGLGSAILEYCIKKYKVNDLSVSPSNKGAISLYKKHG